MKRRNLKVSLSLLVVVLLLIICNSAVLADNQTQVIEQNIQPQNEIFQPITGPDLSAENIETVDLANAQLSDPISLSEFDNIQYINGPNAPMPYGQGILNYEMGIMSNTLAQANTNDIGIFNIPSSTRYIYGRLNSSNADYFIRMCVVDWNAGMITPTDLIFSVNETFRIEAGPGDYAFWIQSRSSVGSDYSLRYNFTPKTNLGIQYHVTSGLDAIVQYESSTQTFAVNGEVVLRLYNDNPALDWERTWTATSSTGGFGGFTKRTVSFSEVKIFPVNPITLTPPLNEPPKSYPPFIVSNVRSYSSSYASTDLAIFIPVYYNTLYMNFTSKYQSGTNPTHDMSFRDGYGRITPLRLDNVDFYAVDTDELTEYLVFDLRSGKVIDFYGNLNSFYTSGQEAPPIIGNPG